MAALAVIAGATMLGSGVRRRRRQSASLLAIDFVRSTFAGRLAKGEPLEELLDQLVEALADSMRLDAAEVWLHSNGVIELAASEPRRESALLELSTPEQSVIANAQVSGPAWAKVWVPDLVAGRNGDAQLRLAPISEKGELLGLIVVERRRRAEQLAADADPTLEELAREVAVGVNNVRLDAALRASLERLRQQALDLQASRARIVSAADAERRRIERDLHDGAQQYLVAMAVKLRLAEQLATQDPAKARATLDQLTADLDQAIEELRSLAHGIYPPLLSSRGLREALGAASRRAPLPAVVAADGIGRYAPEVEAAVYFCCVEALQNAAKHAGDGASANLRVWQEERTLHFDVSDNGCGFDALAGGEGDGLTNMADRLGAVGGRLEVTSAPGTGCSVRGNIPITSGTGSAAPSHPPVTSYNESGS